MLLNSLAKEGLFGVVMFELRPVQVQKAPRLYSRRRREFQVASEVM